MKRRILSAAFLAVVAGFLWAQEPEEIKSGPQVGAKLPMNFNPLNLNGEQKGRPHCPITKFGLEPTVVMVFVREPDKEKDAVLTSLLGKLDKMVKEYNDESYLASFVVFSSPAANNSTTAKIDPDDADLVKKLVDETVKRRDLMALDRAAQSLHLTDPDRLGITFASAKAEPDEPDKKADAPDKKDPDEKKDDKKDPDEKKDDKKDPDEKKDDKKGADPDDKKGADAGRKVRENLPKEGLLVEKVNPGSPAAKAGLMPGDVLLKLNEKPVSTDPAAFTGILEGIKSNTPTPVEVLRGDKKQTLETFMLPPTLIVTCYHESPWQKDEKDPKSLPIHDQAAVTIIVYRKIDVIGNFVFTEAQMREENIDGVLKKIEKLLPKRKI